MARSNRSSNPSAVDITNPDGSVQPGLTVRALANDQMVAVGNWTIREMRKGDVYNVPVPVARHLRDHGLVAIVSADSEPDEWFDQTAETDAELAARVRAVLTGALDEDGNPVVIAGPGGNQDPGTEDANA